jgi:hypothetical protein
MILKGSQITGLCDFWTTIKRIQTVENVVYVVWTI